ncbi:MAG: LuxR C-terminal-related transcriptional regulator [Acidimicrobiia bacterium]|nr:LuxR C-terminal-related transcriptional regulator [Acidimicrobiia bacterium]
MNAAQWASGILSLVTACLALAMVPFVHRARATAKREGSALGNRAGFLMEAGLFLFALGALLRGAGALALVLKTGEAERAVESWGSIAVSAAALAVFIAMARHMRPMLHALRRSERALSVVLGSFQPESLRPENLGLSLREQEVLAVIATGKVSDHEIADTLFISTATAATHVRNILKKAGLHDRRQLVLIGLQEPPA